MNILEGKSIRVIGPASSANLGPGFDAFAIALDGIYDTVETILKKQEGIALSILGKKASSIPTESKENTGGLVATNMFDELGLAGGCIISINKGVPPGYGLGSSAATASAVAYGINKLCKLNLSTSELLKFAASGEIASAGVRHYDNVAGSLLGGFVIVRASDSIDAVTFPPPKSLALCVCIPKIQTPPKKTGQARAVLPKSVTLSDMVQNLSSASLMVAGFAKGDVELIGRAMKDRIVEPARASLVPGYHQVRKNALKAGASGVAISGAGPSMIAFVNLKKAKADAVGASMRKGFASAGVGSDIIITKIGRGARTIAR